MSIQCVIEYSIVYCGCCRVGVEFEGGVMIFSHSYDWVGSWCESSLILIWVNHPHSEALEAVGYCTTDILGGFYFVQSVDNVGKQFNYLSKSASWKILFWEYLCDSDLEVTLQVYKQTLGNGGGWGSRKSL